MSSRPLSVRAAIDADLDEILAMLDDFARGHPAEQHPRPVEALRAAYLGPGPVGRLLVAARRGRIVGMGQWLPAYDMFWATLGARAEWLYVRPEARGRGVAAAIVAEICADVRRAGGQWILGAGGEGVASFYERVALGQDARECIVGGEAFQVLADLAGAPPREIVRGLPDPELNRVASRPRTAAV